MQQPTYAKNLTSAPQRCFNSNTPLKHLYTKMPTVQWW